MRESKPREKRKIAHCKDKEKKKKKKKSFVVQDTCKGVGLGGFFGFRVEDLIAFFYYPFFLCGEIKFVLERYYCVFSQIIVNLSFGFNLSIVISILL